MVPQILEGIYHHPLRWFFSTPNICSFFSHYSVMSTPFNIPSSSLWIHSSLSAALWTMCHMKHNTRFHSVAAQSTQYYPLPPSRSPDRNRNRWRIICLGSPGGHITVMIHGAHPCPCSHAFHLNRQTAALGDYMTLFALCLVNIDEQILR